MSAPIGNKFWEMADPTKIGRPLEFKTPEELWKRACDYFKWCDENPFKEEKIFHHQGNITKASINKMRAYTFKELCLFLGVNKDYFTEFNQIKHKDFSGIITRIHDVIYTQKFTGAAADLLNPNIIARELGLAEKKDLEVVTNLTPEQRKAELAQLKALIDESN
ncbi:terminase small subunit [uncultured Winogradskyella sp.]|uniref:terminase small subunit n=1 Tax=uncultured Winogradskyella sp. TaxID=395353 RepID=UPI00261A961A|nr:terminase small subunit [uncultured Winogradskyella sp.]